MDDLTLAPMVAPPESIRRGLLDSACDEPVPIASSSAHIIGYAGWITGAVCNDGACTMVLPDCQADRSGRWSCTIG